MTNYIGICKKVLSDGSIDHAIVEDTTGMQMPFDPNEYQRRGIRPLLADLPICGKHEKSKEVDEQDGK
ncbi:hypothetical protein [Serratia sp. PL7]|uniref:hypothetical protein n=1 Tax=Serratia sp. PL7 TaxID=2952201 RepID=UPI0019F875E5|nr:hypothetical protein [Serratia sp. PL7]MBE0152636.1 hypothetical protein [Serratia fonticola]